MEVRISATEGMIIVLEFAAAIGGLMTGVGLLLAPDGQHLGWTTEALAGTPFSDYLVPSIILLAINGILPLIVATAALQRRSWSMWGHLVLGSILVGWIGAQLVSLGYLSLLQPIFGAIGFIVTTLALVAIVGTRNRSQVQLPEPSRPRVAPSGLL